MLWVCKENDSMYQYLKKKLERASITSALLKWTFRCSLFTDTAVRIPLTWPKGTYGLPMLISGCPKVPGFTWHQGTRFHDTENTRSSNGWSQQYHLAGKKGLNDMEQKFCIKTQESSNKYDLLWPKGQYCVFKKGACPKGRDAQFNLSSIQHPFKV